MDYAGSTRMTRQGQVTLPSRLRRKLGLDRGDTLEVYSSGETIVMRKKRRALELFEELAASTRARFKRQSLSKRRVMQIVEAARKSRR